MTTGKVQYRLSNVFTKELETEILAFSNAANSRIGHLLSKLHANPDSKILSSFKAIEPVSNHQEFFSNANSCEKRSKFRTKSDNFSALAEHLEQTNIEFRGDF